MDRSLSGRGWALVGVTYADVLADRVIRMAVRYGNCRMKQNGSRSAMVICRRPTFLLTAAVLAVSLVCRTAEAATILLEYLSTSVTTEPRPSTDDECYYCVTTDAASGSSAVPGLVEISYRDVEQSLQRKQDVIIDVRNFDEVAKFGQIPSAHVLPGRSLNTLYAVKYVALVFYLRQGGYVFARLCLSVWLSVC